MCVNWQRNFTNIVSKRSHNKRAPVEEFYLYKIKEQDKLIYCDKYLNNKLPVMIGIDEKRQRENIWGDG